MYKTPIIPVTPIYYDNNSMKKVLWHHNPNYTLDYEAICVFCAFGFMLEKDTYYNEIKVLQPSTQYNTDENNCIIKPKEYWHWNYSPTDRKFNDVLDQFSSILDESIRNKIHNKSVLLPISGGIDSRTLFVPIKNKVELKLCSYEFTDGIKEIRYGQTLAERYDLPFYAQKIQRGYLWNKLDELVEINGCFTDFTHPRQIAVINQLKGLGDVILLGHWGDVLFDRQCDSDSISYDEQLDCLLRKISKPSGLELANELWKYWGLDGSFSSYINNRLDNLYNKINIDHPSARIRAFKSLYWAPRWTSINLPIFGKLGQILLPYYSDEMCKFICSISEKDLSNRKIQIEYIKKYCPKAAEIPWQKYYPLNLNNYTMYNQPFYYPIRAFRKFKRMMSQNSKVITRNWELQYLNNNNKSNLNRNLRMHGNFQELIPLKIINKFMEKFKLYPEKYAHSISMLLCLATLSKRYVDK